MKRICFQEVKERMFINVDCDEDISHPMTQVGLVLYSAAMLGSADARTLWKFTGYSGALISAVAFNMQLNRLWVDGRYDCSAWFDGDQIVSDEEFWDHVGAACGELWFPGADRNLGIPVCKLLGTSRCIAVAFKERAGRLLVCPVPFRSSQCPYRRSLMLQLQTVQPRRPLQEAASFLRHTAQCECDTSAADAAASSCAHLRFRASSSSGVFANAKNLSGLSARHPAIMNLPTWFSVSS